MKGMRRVTAVVRMRCPACLRGDVFVSTFQMLPACQLCGHRFELRPGFFQGPIYVSYALGMVTFLGMAFVARRWLAPDAGRAFALLVAGFCYVLLVPAIFRYCCIIWAHLSIRTPERSTR